MKFVTYMVQRLEKLLNPNNPRWIPDLEFEALQESLTEFGCVEPIIVNLKTQQVVGGHQRIKAAIAQGIKDLPVVEISISSDHEIAFNLALNKIGGEWNYQKLSEILEEIKTEGALLATGFTEDEASVIINENNRSLEQLAQSLNQHQSSSNKNEQTSKTQSSNDDDEDEDDSSPVVSRTTTTSTSTNKPDVDDEEDDDEDEEDEDEDEEDDDEDDITGVTTTIKNKTKKESDETLNASVKVQFGMFTRHIPTASYKEWVAELKNESEQENPLALGTIVAKRLGIVAQKD